MSVLTKDINHTDLITTCHRTSLKNTHTHTRVCTIVFRPLSRVKHTFLASPEEPRYYSDDIKEKENVNKKQKLTKKRKNSLLRL